MAWDQVTLELQTPSCPYADRLAQGERIQCMQPGGGRGLARISGHVDGWKRISGSDLARPASPCGSCPVSRLPEELAVECADVLPGKTRIHAMSPDRATVLRAYETMREAGESPRLRRVAAMQGPRRGRWVDLGALSPRQWDALEEAAAMGYFRTDQGRRQTVADLAARLGCGRSAAHEHLRKAIDRLLGSLLEEHGHENHG